ncbi:MAG: sigma-70 family RNA polymerase sigma factor [Myxococcales bacterium]|nr:sigma-70 family RNA polymerase sigma factor [Myxococcales bacterium]MCB9754323.1 sigma-70 family RNA polymerase sigma factor [Myxococcales bacterium]
MTTDHQLLAAWRAGDPNAGEKLFERHYDAIARFFHNKAGEQAPDLIQKTFLVCIEAHEKLREDTRFRAFLFGIARNVLYDHFRKRRRHDDRIDFGARSVEDMGPTPTSMIAREQEIQLLMHALRKIPLDYQVILELYYWESMSARELSEALEIPEGTARTRLRRARQLLDRELKRLARSPHLLQSTISDMESWVSRIRGYFGTPGDRT